MWTAEGAAPSGSPTAAPESGTRFPLKPTERSGPQASPCVLTATSVSPLATHGCPCPGRTKPTPGECTPASEWGTYYVSVHSVPQFPHLYKE